MSRQRLSRLERGRCRELTVIQLHRVAAVLGLDASVRLYPAGPPIRDVAHARRLASFVAHVRLPLRYGLETPLPRLSDHAELRAWDCVLSDAGSRTAVELEIRLRDVQAVIRRIDLKRRDDPTEHFLLLVADTRNNRRVLAEFGVLFADLPRLRPSAVRAALLAGRHPGSGILLV